jgi:ATP adenylyltransferase
MVTRALMLLLPRTQASHGGIEVNALGFAGALLVRNREQLELVRSQGPMTLLRSVSVGRD